MKMLIWDKENRSSVIADVKPRKKRRIPKELLRDPALHP